MTKTKEDTTAIAVAISDHRAACRALRRLQSGGGRTAATTHAIYRHEAARDRAWRKLAVIGQKRLVGLLTEEHRLLVSIAERKANGAGHAELSARLTKIHRDIRRDINY